MKLKTLVKELKSFAATLFDVFTAERDKDLRIEQMIINDRSVSVKDLDVNIKDLLNDVSFKLRKKKDAVMSDVKEFEEDES